jgi:hypothetical protein
MEPVYLKIIQSFFLLVLSVGQKTLDDVGKAELFRLNALFC